MRFKSIFCGIFASAFIVATVALVSSCSQDDDEYNSDMYTLAEQMDTRSGWEGNSWTIIKKGSTIVEITLPINYRMSFKLSWPRCALSSVKANVTLEDTFNNSGYVPTAVGTNIRRYKFTRCVIDTDADCNGTEFLIDDICVYYKEARINPETGYYEYGDEQLVAPLVSLRYSITEDDIEK